MKRIKSKIKKTPRIHKKQPPGSAPGIGKNKGKANNIELLAYDANKYFEQTFTSFDDVKGFIKLDQVCWINVSDLSNEHLISEIGEYFGLHHLSLEDVVNAHQRSKAEPYGDILFLVMRMSDGKIGTEQLSLFVGKNFVLSFQERPTDRLDPIKKRIQAGGRIKTANAGYLAYAIIDAIIDDYFPVLEVIADQLDTMEEILLSNADQISINQIHEAKSELLLLRRTIWAHREMVYSLVREKHPQFDAETMVFIRDCYDHTLQQLDLVETYRDIGSSLMDLSFSAANKQSADIMKVLTIVASIFIPLTFIAGIYGMNFNVSKSPWNMPELQWYYGYPMALSIMLVVALGLLGYFKKKNWL